MGKTVEISRTRYAKIAARGGSNRARRIQQEHTRTERALTAIPGEHELSWDRLVEQSIAGY
jgi:hypothetical protein